MNDGEMIFCRDISGLSKQIFDVQKLQAKFHVNFELNILKNRDPIEDPYV